MQPECIILGYADILSTIFRSRTRICKKNENAADDGSEIANPCILSFRNLAMLRATCKDMRAIINSATHNDTWTFLARAHLPREIFSIYFDDAKPDIASEKFVAEILPSKGGISSLSLHMLKYMYTTSQCWFCFSIRGAFDKTLDMCICQYCLTSDMFCKKSDLYARHGITLCQARRLRVRRSVSDKFLVSDIHDAQLTLFGHALSHIEVEAIKHSNVQAVQLRRQNERHQRRVKFNQRLSHTCIDVTYANTLLIVRRYIRTGVPGIRTVMSSLLAEYAQHTRVQNRLQALKERMGDQNVRIIQSLSKINDYVNAGILYPGTDDNPNNAECDNTSEEAAMRLAMVPDTHPLLLTIRVTNYIHLMDSNILAHNYLGDQNSIVWKWICDFAAQYIQDNSFIDHISLTHNAIMTLGVEHDPIIQRLLLAAHVANQHEKMFY